MQAKERQDKARLLGVSDWSLSENNRCTLQEMVVMKISRKQLRKLIAEAAGRRIARPMYFTTDDKNWRIEIQQDRGRYYWYLYVISPTAYGGARYRPPELMYYEIIDDSKSYKPGYYYSLADCIEHMAYVFESDRTVNYNTLSVEKPTSGLRKLVREMQ